MNQILSDTVRVGTRLMVRVAGRRQPAEVVTYSGTRHLLTLQVRTEDEALHRITLSAAQAAEAQAAAQ